MKKLVLMLVILLGLSGVSHAAESVKHVDRSMGQRGWHKHIIATDNDTTAGLVTWPTRFTQLTSAAYLEAITLASDNTVEITVNGIDGDGNKLSYTIEATTSTVASAGTTKFTYFDSVELSGECTAGMFIQTDAGTTVTNIATGEMVSGIAQHFTGDETTYLTSWGASATASTVTAGQYGVGLELRWYRDDADCLDATDGYEVIDSLYVGEDRVNPYRTFSQPIKLAAGGWLAVYAESGINNSPVAITLQGYDV